MRLLKTLIFPLSGFLLSLLICSLILVASGENFSILIEAFYNTFFTHFGLGYTFFYATPLIFTGLSVAVAARSGLFNIGAEGQLYIGSVLLTFFATKILLPTAFGVPLAIVIACAGGALWGGLAGFLKSKMGSHEVIVTILLNFIAYSLTDYSILYLFKNPLVQNPESLEIYSSYRLPLLSDWTALLGLETFATTPVNATLLLALFSAFAVHFFLFHTKRGYEMRAVGFNPKSSQFNGINVSQNTLLAFVIAGGLTGGVAVNEIMGHQYKLTQGFSVEYGFTGIAVALLARNHPIGILFSAILFGSLHNASREMEFLSEKVTKELSLVLQALMIAFVASEKGLSSYFDNRKKRSSHV